jgi:hypothetical protein
MRLSDILEGSDGKMSLTNLAAASAYLAMFAAFLKFQVIGDVQFNETLWLLFGGFAIGHQTLNRTTSIIKDFKYQKLQVESAAPLPADPAVPPQQPQQQGATQ